MYCSDKHTIFAYITMAYDLLLPFPPVLGVSTSAAGFRFLGVTCTLLIMSILYIARSISDQPNTRHNQDDKNNALRALGPLLDSTDKKPET